MTRAVLRVLLLVVAWAVVFDQATSRAVVEVESPTSDAQADPEVAAVIDAGEAQGPAPQTAARLRAFAESAGLDRVVGHLLAMAGRGGEARARAFELLYFMGTGGRGDVADLFVEGLDDPQSRVRWAAAQGLRAAPPDRRRVAGLALIDRLSLEPDARVYHVVLAGLEAVAGPEHRDRADAVRGLLRAAPTAPAVSLEQEAIWKYKLATALIEMVGVEAALQTFDALDPAEPQQRLALEGAAMALATYGARHFGDMPPARRDALRDDLRGFALRQLAQKSKAEAERDRGIRRAVTEVLVGVVLMRRENVREEDVIGIRAALGEAVAFEPSGSELATTMLEILALLDEEGAER